MTKLECSCPIHPVPVVGVPHPPPDPYINLRVGLGNAKAGDRGWPIASSNAAHELVGIVYFLIRVDSMEDLPHDNPEAVRVNLCNTMTDEPKPLGSHATLVPQEELEKHWIHEETLPPTTGRSKWKRPKLLVEAWGRPHLAHTGSIQRRPQARATAATRHAS